MVGGTTGQTGHIQRISGKSSTIAGTCLTVMDTCVRAGTGGTAAYAILKTVPGTGITSIRRQADRLRARAGGAGRMGPWRYGM